MKQEITFFRNITRNIMCIMSYSGDMEEMSNSNLKQDFWLTSEMIEDFLTEKAEEGWSVERLKRARHRLAIFRADLSANETITESKLAHWREQLEERGLSNRTIAEYMAIVNQLLEYTGYSEFVSKRGNPLDLTGRKFGMLTAIETVSGKRSKERSVIWKCRCDCGKIIEVPANHLTKGFYTSCGCAKPERLKEANQYVDGTSLKMVFSDTVRKDNTSGYKGVFQKRDKWGVRIQYKGKRYYLGTYENLDDAVRIRDDAQAKIREDAEALLLDVVTN